MFGDELPGCPNKYSNRIGGHYMNDRDKLIKEKIEEKEKITSMQYRGVKHFVYETLIHEKGYHPDEIQADPQFRIALSDCESVVTADFLITIKACGFMIIHCVSSGIESWERYVIACARAITDYQIPFAVATDGEMAKLFDIFNNSSRQLAIDDLPNRREAADLMKNFTKKPYSQESLERERRIIYAFEGIKCQPAKGHDS
jgi:hypothetical protein